MIPAGRVRLRRLATTVLLALAVWASALPFVVVLVVPRVGIGLGIAIATGLLVGMFLLCWVLSVPGYAQQGSRVAPEPVAGGRGKLEPARSWPQSDPGRPRFTVVVPPDLPEVQQELAQKLSGENVRVILGPAAGAEAAVQDPATGAQPGRPKRTDGR